MGSELYSCNPRREYYFKLENWTSKRSLLRLSSRLVILNRRYGGIKRSIFLFISEFYTSTFILPFSAPMKVFSLEYNLSISLHIVHYFNNSLRALVKIKSITQGRRTLYFADVCPECSRFTDNNIIEHR